MRSKMSKFCVLALLLTSVAFALIPMSASSADVDRFPRMASSLAEPAPLPVVEVVSTLEESCGEEHDGLSSGAM